MINWQLSKQGIRWPVSPDRIAGSGVDPSRSSIFLKLSADKLLVFKWSQTQVWFVFKLIWNKLCLCAAQLKFWFQTDLGRENLASCYRQGRQLLLSLLAMFTRWSRPGHVLRPIFMLWLVKIWQVSSCGKFMQHLESCLLWQSFVSTCDVFNCLFPLDVQNEIQLLSGVFCYSWLVCLLGFWLRNTSLVKVGNPISDGIVFVFTLLSA